MTLWERILRITGVTVVVLLALAYTLPRFVLMRGFATLERWYVERDVERAWRAVVAQMDELDLVASDWAAWDDTYAFVQDGNERYREVNLLDDAFIATKLNLLLIADADGWPVFVKGFDLQRQREMDIPEFAGSALRSSGALLDHRDAQSRLVGVVMLSAGPMLVASRPIVTSAGEGPIRGTLIMGRFLDEALVARLGEATQLALQVRRLDTGDLAGEWRTAVEALSDVRLVWVQPLSEEMVAGYRMVYDVYGRPALLLRAECPRDIYVYGGRSLMVLAPLLSVASLVLLAVIVLVVETVVIRPVQELSQRVREIGASRDLSARVAAPRADEIGDLAMGINTMLGHLQRADEEARQRERYLGAVARAAQALLQPDLVSAYASFLEPLGQAVEASRACVFEVHHGPADELLASVKGEWCAPGVQPLVDHPGLRNVNLAERGLQRWVEMLRRGELVSGVVTELPPAERELLEPQGVRAILVVPATSDHAWLGFIALARCDEARPWTAAECDMLRVAAADLSQALRHRRQEELQVAIYRISEAVHEVQSLDELFAMVHRIVGGLMSAKNLYIALYNPQSEMLSFPYFVDQYDSPPPPQRPGRGLTEYVLRTGKPLLASTELFERLVAEGLVESRGAASIDWLGVPLQAQGQTIGVLAVQSYTSRVRYGPREQEILEFVSGQIAMAIERKTAAVELQEAERRFSSLLDNVRLVAVGLDRSGNVDYANPYLLELTGYTLEEVRGRNWFETFVPERERPAVGSVFSDLIKSQFPRHYGNSILTKTGEERLIAWNNTVLVGTDGTPVGTMSIGEDITDRQRLEDELRRLKEFNEGIVRDVAEGLLLEDAEGIITFVNPALEEMVGYSSAELVGFHWAKMVHEADLPAMLERVKARPRGVAEVYEARLRARDGSVVPVLVSARPLFEGGRFTGVLTAFADLRERFKAAAERDQLEEQLRQAQKMEMLGLIAGGVAHYFNNLLAVIQGNAELAQMQLPATHPLYGDLAKILGAARRGSLLTQQLLAFSRRRRLEPKPFDLNAHLRAFGEMVGPLLGADVQVELNLAPDLPLVTADAAALEQVWMNLAVNAKDAMPQGGKLWITTELVGSEDGFFRRHPEATRSGYVRVSVLDNGIGMDEQTRARLFEPFFTTKEVGRGTGLGLAVAYGIVQQHGGLIEVESQVGKGSRFGVYLPVS